MEYNDETSRRIFEGPDNHYAAGILSIIFGFLAILGVIYYLVITWNVSCSIGAGNCYDCGWFLGFLPLYMSCFASFTTGFIGMFTGKPKWVPEVGFVLAIVALILLIVVGISFQARFGSCLE